MMGIVNMLLSLPAGRQMLALPADQTAPLEAVMRQLREQANAKAATAKAQENESLAEYWRLVSTYSKYVARAFKRENLKRGTSPTRLDHPIGTGSDFHAPATRLDRYAGAHAFRLPSAAGSLCMLEAVHMSFTPWVTIGDYIQVDFAVAQLADDSLYLVAVDGKYLAIRGFHRGPSGWYVHESSNGEPRLMHMLDARRPEGFDVVGRISDVFKKQSFGGA